MSEFLEHFGGIIVAIIVASVLSTMLIFTRDSCNAVLSEQVIASADCEEEYTDVNSIITEDAPELSITDNLTVELGEEFHPEDAVISAYNSQDFSIHEISGNAAKNINNVKKALVAGKVNIVYPQDFDINQEGKYTVTYYAKNNSRGGVWTRKKCCITVVQYETLKEEG